MAIVEIFVGIAGLYVIIKKPWWQKILAVLFVGLFFAVIQALGL